MPVAVQNMYNPVMEPVPRYRYQRVPLNNLSSTTVLFPPTSTNLLEWKISASTCHNLSRSFVQYQWTLPALAANYGVSFEDGHDFRDVYWGNGSGLIRSFA